MTGSSPNGDFIRVAAIGDLHCTRTSQGLYQPLLRQIAQTADVLVICGDLTDYGLPEEAHVLVKELSPASKLPIVTVLGNHDCESGQQDAVKHILQDAGVIVLDGDATEVKGIGFAGTKGFCGGFGRGTLSAWGEPVIKAFVQEAIDEAMKLESALARLRTAHKVALLHYSPIRETVEGEPPEIFPFLGCRRLEEPLNRYQVSAALHGHAHRGAPEGRTGSGTKVYNVSIQTMRASYPDRPPFRMLTFPATPQAARPTTPSAAAASSPIHAQPVESAVR
jgi:Icc-related predicted phosphoesterase